MSFHSRALEIISICHSALCGSVLNFRNEMRNLLKNACRSLLLNTNGPHLWKAFQMTCAYFLQSASHWLSCRALNCGGVNDILTENKHGLFCILIARLPIKKSDAALHAEAHNLSLLTYQCCTHICPSHASHILFPRNSFFRDAHTVPVTAYPASQFEIKSGDTLLGSLY